MIVGNVKSIRCIADCIPKEQANLGYRVMHPCGIVSPEQEYADLLITNRDDSLRLNDFIKSGKYKDLSYGEIATHIRTKNILKDIFKNESTKIYDAKIVADAIKQKQFDFNELSILGV